MERKVVKNEFPPVFNAESKVLILGSLPSEASRAAGFYYMNPRNRFWAVMSSLLKADLPSMNAEGKAVVLLCRGVALSDVILSCRIHRSADASIEIEEYTDVESILRASKIKRIFLNGQKAYSLFLRRYPEKKEIATLLPSTSPANAKLSLSDLIASWGATILPFLE